MAPSLPPRQHPGLNGFLINSLIDLRAVEAASLMERAFAADSVDISIMGDWEDVQIELGLLDERQTPKPHYVSLPGWLPPTPPPPAEATAQQQWKEERKVERRRWSKRKAQRKRRKEARRKQRKRK